MPTYRVKLEQITKTYEFHEVEADSKEEALVAVNWGDEATLQDINVKDDYGEPKVEEVGAGTVDLTTVYPIGTRVEFDLGGRVIDGQVTGYRGVELEITGLTCGVPNLDNGRYYRSPSDYIIRRVSSTVDGR